MAPFYFCEMFEFFLHLCHFATSSTFPLRRARPQISREVTHVSWIKNNQCVFTFWLSGLFILTLSWTNTILVLCWFTLLWASICNMSLHVPVVGRYVHPVLVHKVQMWLNFNKQIVQPNNTALSCFFVWTGKQLPQPPKCPLHTAEQLPLLMSKCLWASVKRRNGSDLKRHQVEGFCSRDNT